MPILTLIRLMRLRADADLNTDADANADTNASPGNGKPGTDIMLL
jgi:hypothetical protein